MEINFYKIIIISIFSEDNVLSTKSSIVLVKVTEWPPIGKIAAHSAYDMFHDISA